MNANNRLAKTIALGRKRYVIIYGVLGMGLSSAALFTAWTFYSNEKIGVLDVVLPFIIFPVGGIFWGLSMWTYFEKKAAKIASDTGK